MSYIYEDDVSKVGGNLQKTVGYLLSLHKNEYEWNLLGIKVVGHVDALPIPDGTYDYGDAYTVGTAAPYDMWIYTRADATHPQDYWFNIGKFPAPGPQGPAGPSLVDVTKFEMGTIQKVYYDATFGADITGTATMTYKDPNTCETKKDTIDDFSIRLPLFGAGNYMTVDANAAEDGVDVKLDDTQLALDFWKINKTPVNTAPLWVASNGKPYYAATTNEADGGTFAYRDSSGSIKFHNIGLRNALTDNAGGSVSYADQICSCANPTYSEKVITKTSTDTGTITTELLNDFKHYPQLHIIYDNQLYYRQDPLAAPDGTMNFIHIDAVQDGSGGYTAKGKCFSITVSTRAWQVVDLDFGGGGGSSIKLYNHHIQLSTNTGDKYFFDVTDTASSYTNTATIQSKHNDPINVLFADAGATTVYNPKIIRFTDTGDLQVLTAGNAVSETVTASSIKVSDQVQLIS